MSEPRPVVALLGTSADPPSNGHRSLLSKLAEHFPCVATWASDNPLKEHAAPLHLRVALLEALVEGAFGVFFVEMAQEAHDQSGGHAEPVLRVGARAG